MIITLSPVRDDSTLTLSLRGGTLCIDGTEYDLSPLPEGATLPREAMTCDRLLSDVERSGGIVRMTLAVPHGAQAAETERAIRTITLADGATLYFPPTDGDAQ